MNSYTIIFQKEGGFFVEIGAHDGQNLSNTLWLERQHLWSGLLIEANSDLCQKLDKLTDMHGDYACVSLVPRDQ